MFLVASPALRTIAEPQTRLSVTRILFHRFGWLVWSAMAVIVLSGISNLFEETEEFGHVFDPDFRYFHIFVTKMVLVGLTVLLTALHTFVIVPRQVLLHEEMRADSAEAVRLRRASLILSSLALLASVAVLYAAVLLANHEFSSEPA